MKVCEICGSEEKWSEEQADDDDELLLGVCEQCMQDFAQG